MNTVGHANAVVISASFNPQNNGHLRREKTHGQRIWATLYAVVVAIVALHGACEDVVVVFPDPNLEAAIREAISKPTGDILDNDLLGMTELVAPLRSIQNLTGLEYAINLLSLTLHSNQISDLSPLAALSSLSTLDLNGNLISNLGPLSGLSSLSILQLEGNQIADLSGLAGLGSVYDLQLDFNQISDLSPLSGLGNVIYLGLWSNQISDLSPLSGLSSLSELSVGSNPISDLSPLSGLTNLFGLYLGSSQISDLSPLAALSTIGFLGLEYNQVSDLSPLAGLENLHELRLDFNQVSDLNSLVVNPGLGAGVFITLYGNPLSQDALCADIPALQARGVAVSFDGVCGATVVVFPDPNLEAAIREAINKPTGDILVTDLLGLTSFTAHSRAIQNLTGLEYAVNLEWLDLTSNQISSMSPLAGLTKLQVLYLQSNQITGIFSLSSITSLQFLDLYNNQISDLGPLSSLGSLSSLNLGSNQISDIVPLVGLTNLTYIGLSSNQVSDITALSGLTNLAYIDLSSNQVTDVSPLVANAGLDAFDYVRLEGNSLTQDALCIDIPALQARGVTVSFDGECAGGLVVFPDPNLEAAVREAIGKPMGDIDTNDLLGLIYLTASSRGIQNLSGLEFAINLSYLDLSHNDLTYLQPLAGATDLVTLNLDYNQISNVSPLAGLTELGTLSLVSNPFSDLTPVSGLTNLQQLIVESTLVSNLGPLAGLTNLTGLSLRANQIVDLGPLSGLTNLIALDVDFNQVSDLSPLAGLTGLSGLGLSQNQIVDIAPLVANSGLGASDRVYLEGNPLSQVALCIDIPQLQARGALVEHTGTCGGGEAPCAYAGVFNDPVTGQGPIFAGMLPLYWPDVAALLATHWMNDWETLDLEHLEAVVAATRSRPGDGLPDSFQMALVEYCLCNPNSRAHADTLAGFLHNKALFATDMSVLAAAVGLGPEDLAPQIRDLLPAMIGTSQAMKDTIHWLFLQLTGGLIGLPSYQQYVVFGVGKTAEEPFSAEGDFDNDGIPNLDEYQAVIEAGGDMDLFVQAASDPYNLWPGNPALPATGVVALGLLLAALGGMAVRRKKQ